MQYSQAQRALGSCRKAASGAGSKTVPGPDTCITVALEACNPEVRPTSVKPITSVHLVKESVVSPHSGFRAVPQSWGCVAVGVRLQTLQCSTRLKRLKGKTQPLTLWAL